MFVLTWQYPDEKGSLAFHPNILEENLEEIKGSHEKFNFTMAVTVFQTLSIPTLLNLPKLASPVNTLTPTSLFGT